MLPVTERVASNSTATSPRNVSPTQKPSCSATSSGSQQHLANKKRRDNSYTSLADLAVQRCEMKLEVLQEEKKKRESQQKIAEEDLDTQLKPAQLEKPKLAWELLKLKLVHMQQTTGIPLTTLPFQVIMADGTQNGETQYIDVKSEIETM